MKKIAHNNVLKICLVSFFVLVILSFGEPVYAVVPVNDPGQPSTQGLQYTGSYCGAGFNGKLQTGTSTVAGVLRFGTCLIQTAFIPLLFAVAILVFIYGIVKFIGNEESAEKEDGKQFMMWGIIALAVMFSVWGLVEILGNTFGVMNVIPSLPASK